MKKVRVIKEMPFVKVGAFINVTDEGYLDAFSGCTFCASALIREGWLEEVKEPQNIVKDAYKYQTDFGVVELGDELARKIATAAMKYASEVASKAVLAKYQALHPQAVLIIETLLKEAEVI